MGVNLLYVLAPLCRWVNAQSACDPTHLSCLRVRSPRVEYVIAERQNSQMPLKDYHVEDKLGNEAKAMRDGAGFGVRANTL